DGRCVLGLLHFGGGEQSWLELVIGIRHGGFDSERAPVRLQSRRHVADRCSELASRISVHLEGDRLPDRDGGEELLGHRKLSAEWIDTNDNRNFHAPRDVI